MKIWLPAIRAGTGTDVFTERLASALVRRGVPAEVTWFDGRFELLPELLGVRRPPPGTTVIHANSWSAHAFLRHGLPVVTTVHHLVHDPRYSSFKSLRQALYHRFFLRWRERRAILLSQAVTTVSEYVASTVRSFAGRPDIDAIPNWVDVDAFRPGAGRKKTDGEPFRLLLVANDSYRKGSDLLPVLVQLLGEGFEVVRTGGLRGGMASNGPVVCLGKVSESELIQHYQACDAVLSLSRYEGFGYSALEGMACAKPVVGFRTSGFAEVVEDGVTGLLAEPEDIPALVKHIRSLVGNPARAVQLGLAGRRRAESVFSVDRAVARYINVYERCHNGGGKQ